MGKKFYLPILLISFFMYSCKEQKVKNYNKVVEDVEYRGWFNLSMIRFEDGDIAYRSPGWISDMNIKKGSIVTVPLTPSDYPDSLLLYPKHEEQVLDSETKEFLCVLVHYEDENGLLYRKKNYKELKYIKPILILYKGEGEYFEQK